METKTTKDIMEKVANNFFISKRFIGYMNKKILILLSIFIIFGLGSLTAFSATKHTLQDFGLSEEDVKYLSPTEIESMLNGNTPAEERERIQKSGTPEEKALLNLALASTVGLPKNAVDCFDYYKFGSIQTDLSSSISNVSAGNSMEFSGSVINENNYPIVDGTLYVKIFRERNTEKDINGPDVVDQFVAMDDLAIPANSSISVSFSWKIPDFAKEGDYRLVSFFIVDKKFNLLGLSFTDDVVGNPFNFNVSGKKTNVEFDKAEVTINDLPYYFAAFPPLVPSKDIANVSAKINNTTDKDETVGIVWKLYSWDSIDPDNFIRTSTSSIKVKANSSSNIKISIPENTSSVYYLIGELSYKDSKSIIGVRFVRPEVDKLRLNFPSITKFPIEKGTDLSMFSCVHNSGSSSLVPDGKLILKLLDNAGKVINEYTYEGGITGEMMAVKKDFRSPKILNQFSLYAELWQGDKIVDQSKIDYDCNKIDPKSCKTDYTIFIMIGGVILLIILIVLFKFRGKKIIKKVNKKKVGLLLLILLFGFYFSPSIMQAKSAQWNYQNSDMLYYYSDGGWGGGLNNIGVTVTYNAEIRDTNTGATVSDGAFLSIGAKLTLKFLPHISTDIVWSGVGHVQGTPYGEWRAGSAPPPTVSCDLKDYVSHYGSLGNFYVPLVVSPPTKTITTTGMTCGSQSGNESIGYTKSCVVIDDLSPITAKFNYDTTSGKFYWRLFYYGTDIYSGCRGNNIPMRGYDLIVPIKSISYNLNRTITSVPPPAPTIAGPTKGYVGKGYQFSFVSTNSDGDTMKYGVDWTLDNIMDQWLPGSGFANSGTAQNVTKSWSSIGNYSFKAKAFKSLGASSVWSNTHTFQAFPLPVTNLSIFPLSIISGSSSTISWSSTDAKDCIASASPSNSLWSGSKATSSGSQSTGILTTSVASTTFSYTLKCIGNGGDDGFDTKTVDVSVISPPSVTLKATPSSVLSGQETKLSWSSVNVSNCTSTKGTSPVWNNSGAGISRTTSNSSGITSNAISTTTEFVITCMGLLGGPVSSSVTVGVNYPPTINLSANPSIIKTGETSTSLLSWSTTNTTGNCISAMTSGSDTKWTSPSSKPLNGSTTTKAITTAGTYSYKLTCSGPGGSTSSIATVIASSTYGNPPSTPSPTVSLLADRNRINLNEKTTLNWTATNANTCSASMSQGTDSVWTLSPSKNFSGGSQDTSNLPNIGTYIYKLSCIGNGGSASSTASVQVVSLPIVSLTADNINLSIGSSTILHYSSSNADSCSSVGFSQTKNTSGSISTGALNEEKDYDYSLRCSNSEGTATATVSISVSDSKTFVPTCCSTRGSVDCSNSVAVNNIMTWKISGIPGSTANVTYTIDGSDFGPTPYTVDSGTINIPKIYTTVGQKDFSATITSGGKTGSCPMNTNTTVVQEGGGIIEF
jgi:hypothetical protein